MFTYEEFYEILPHFLSWVIIGGIFLELLAIDGIDNKFVEKLGSEPIAFAYSPGFSRSLLVGVGIWKEVGWGTIIYLVAASAINPTLYEAATVDGAGRWRKMWSIMLPSLMPTIVTLFLLRIGHMRDSNVEQVINTCSPRGHCGGHSELVSLLPLSAPQRLCFL
jgi:putative aldouronate transport system permease protein